MFSSSARRGLAALSISAATLSACAELSPVGPQSKVGDHAARQVVLALAAPCSLSPGGAPMGRPDGVRGHTLPAGRYAPAFEDDHGIFFASPNGIVVMEPAPLGTRARAGGIYLPSDGAAAAEEYLGDKDRVTQRYRLPEHCRYSIENENAAAPATPG
ncbi:MAG: hypothetical protein ABI895_14215 [Deltaproteobacteria bacterium]